MDEVHSTTDMDEVHGKLAEITQLVEGARAMPMSASCVVNRADLLALLAELEALGEQEQETDSFLEEPLPR